MSIPGYSVKNRVTMTMFYTLVIAFGIFSFFRLQVDLYPDMDIPYVMVMTTYIGASPADIETLISRPIEETATSVTGVKNVMSTSKDNVSMVILEFDWGYDMYRAEIDTRNKLDLVKGQLPDEVDAPIVIAMDPSMQPIVMFNLTSPDKTQAELRKIAEDRIQPMLERVEGISSVDVGGGALRQIHIRLNPQKLEAFNIAPLTIVQLVAAENSQSVGGYIEASGMDLSIQSAGKYKSVEEIGEILVSAGASETGQMIPIRLRDVADIEDTVEESRRYVEVNGHSSIMMLASKQSGANTVDAARGIIEALPSVTASEGLGYNIINDQSEFINDSMKNLGETCVMSIVIVFFVLLAFFKSFTTSLIVATAIPTSLMATFGFMSSMGMTLNVISMAGLSLAVGMLVDNAIVTLENIFRHREEGDTAFQAAVVGTKEIMMAITASTLTTIAVFLPILFVPGIAGMMFRDMSLTICGALTVSLVVAITFVPMLSYYMLKSPRFDKTIRANSGKEVDDLSTLSAKEQQSLTNRMRKGYENMLRGFIKARWLVTCGVVLLFALSIIGFKYLVPMEFMPASDDSFLNVTVTTEMGTDSRTTYHTVKECVEIIKGVIPDNERKMINIDVGSSDSGMGAIFSSGVNSGKIRVRLVKPKFRDRDINQIIDDVREALRDVPGIQYQVTGRGGPGGGGGGDIDIEVYNDDIQETRKVTNRIRRMALARPDIAEVKLSVDEQKPQIQVDFDREKMSELGLNTSVVGNLLMIFFRGVEASRYLDSGDEYDIVVRYDRAFRNSIKEIENMPIQTNAGDIVPLSTIARVYENLAPTAIERKNQERYQKVSLTLKNSYTDASGKTVDKDLNKTINEISAMLDEIRAEDKERGFDWYYQLSGTAENFQDSMKALFFALIISIFLVYMVMASQFESYREPFIVLLTVPLGLIGVAAIFILTGRAMDMSALIGIIMLVGIVVNNGIVMVDAANQNRARGMDLETAIVNAARTRMRPVMMTTLTTVLSMIPLALKIGEGSETWAGMGTTVVGGLSAATLLTLFFVPIMYTFFASKKFEMPEYEEELDVISRKKDDAPEVATDNA